jgi:hypothetical protein
VLGCGCGWVRRLDERPDRLFADRALRHARRNGLVRCRAQARGTVAQRRCCVGMLPHAISAPTGYQRADYPRPRVAVSPREYTSTREYPSTRPYLTVPESTRAYRNTYTDRSDTPVGRRRNSWLITWGRPPDYTPRRCARALSLWSASAPPRARPGSR